MTKICAKCKIELPTSEFNKDRSRNGGLDNRCRLCLKEYKENHYLKNKVEIQKKQKIYRIEHHLEILEQKREHYRNNKEELIQQQGEYHIRRRKTDINFKILCNLRKRIWNVLRNNSKSEHTITMLGCSIEQLKEHLEKYFQDGMSWNNYGTGWHGKGMNQWHLDHIIPCVRFDLSKKEEQAKCFHYTNLQPLWAEENLIKGKKF